VSISPGSNENVGQEALVPVQTKIIYIKFYIRFQRLRPFAQFLVSQNSKGNYESRKILDFVQKKEKMTFFELFFISFVVSSTFWLF
jgi:hypothetical protein